MERRYRMCEEPRGPQKPHYERPRQQVATSPKLSAQAGCQRSPALCARSQDQQGRDCFSSRTTSTCQSSGEKSSSANAQDLCRCQKPRILCHISISVEILSEHIFALNHDSFWGLESRVRVHPEPMDPLLVFPGSMYSYSIY